MRIKKTSQYLEDGASISNVYGTSQENGYTQDYINNLHTTSDWNSINTNYSCFSKKVGNLVTITCSTSTNISLTGYAQTSIGSVPNNCKPSKNLRFAVYARGSNVVYGQVNTNGLLILFNWGSALTLEAGTLAFTVTYIVD